MFEFSDIQKLVELFNPKQENSDTEDENEGPKESKTIKTTYHQESETAETKKVNPYAKIETGDSKQTERREMLDPENEDILLEEEEQKSQADWKKVPTWNISYKQLVGASDVFLQMGLKNTTTASCEDMLVTIELPGERHQNVDLKIKKENLVLISPKYYLELPLPHPVNPQKGNAKFDNDTGKLIITLRMDREFDVVNF